MKPFKANAIKKKDMYYFSDLRNDKLFVNIFVVVLKVCLFWIILFFPKQVRDLAKNICED